MFCAIKCATAMRRSKGCAMYRRTASEDQSPWSLMSSTGAPQRNA